MRLHGTGSGTSWLPSGAPTAPVANCCGQRSAIWAMPGWTALPGSARDRRWNSMPCSPPSGSGPSASTPVTTATLAAWRPGRGISTAWPAVTGSGSSGLASLSGQPPAISQTRRCSRSGASWCTSGASSSLSILGCLASCCPPAGQARMPPSCSVPKPTACCLPPGDLLTAVWPAAPLPVRFPFRTVQATSRGLVWSAGRDDLLVRADDPLGRLDQIGDRQPVIAALGLLPPHDLAPAPNGQPPGDRKHRQVPARLGNRHKAGPQASVGQRTGQLRDRPRAPRRQPLAGGQLTAGRNAQGEPDRLALHLPRSEPAPAQMMTPAAGRQARNHLQSPAADRIGAGGPATTAPGRLAPVPTRFGVENLADQLPARAEAPDVHPDLRHAADRAALATELDVAVGVHRVGGEFAGHSDAVVDQVAGQVGPGERFTKESPGGAGARMVERKRPYEAAATADASFRQPHIYRAAAERPADQRTGMREPRRTLAYRGR